MASLEITNDNKIKVNVNSSDSWSLNVNNSNFMLKKYNGIGSSTVELKTFSNVGELFGEIELYVNGKLCNNYDLKQIDNVESDFFYIIPNVINLNGKGDVRNVIVYTNDSQWEYEILNNNNRIIVSKENNNLIITSNIDEIFYDLRIKIYSNNLDGKPYDYVTVNQTFKSYISEEEGDLFKVNPTYLLFTKPNEVKNVTVTTSCKDGYEISTVTTPFSLTDNGKGKLSVKYIGDGNTSASTSFNVTSCGSSKKVDIKYDNSFNSQNYLYIISSNTQYSEVTTSLVKNGENDSLGILEYELSSTSKVMVYSKPNQIVASISNLDGNNSCKLRVQFDNNEDFQGQIKLRNNDGIFAYINISISGYGDAKGIVFKFNDTNENTKVLESNENGEYSITIDSYYNKNKTPLNFNINTNDFNLKGSGNLKPFKPSSSSTTLTFTAKSNVKGTKTIQLEEVETFKRLYIKINIDYGNAYYNFYFMDGNNDEYYTWYLTYDYQGNLYEETPMYSKIISLSGNSINNINKEVLFTPNSYSKEQLGIVSELTGSTNYSSSFTFTQSGSNNKLTLYVTQVSAEKCNTEINYDNGSVEISTPSSIDKCFENINDFEVSLNNVSILDENCEYTYSSFTLTQGTDYELTFEPSGENQSNEEREIQVTLQGKGIYSDLISSFTMTQDIGPCFDPYYEFCIYTSATFTECLSSETVSYNTSSDNYNVTIISRYYTAETSYDTINFTLSTNDSWIHINGTNHSVDLNNTTSKRNGSITYKQDGSDYEVYLYINQNAYVPTEPTCNTPIGSFASDYDFRVDFSEPIESDVTISIDEKDGDCNVVNSFEVTVSKGKKTGYGYDVLDQNHNNVVAAYFEITNVNPSSDDYYYYWGNGCDYDDSGNCSPKTKIKVIFNGNITRMSLEGNSSGYGCDTDGNNDEYELYLPESIITDYNITYKIEGVTTIPSELFIIVESRLYHIGHEDTGVTSFNPTSLSGKLTTFNCDVRVSDEVCKNVEQDCSPTSWSARLSDYSKYDLEIVDNVKENEEDIDCDSVAISCNPTTAYTSGDAVRTTVTLIGSKVWEVETEKGIGSGETGGYFTTSVLGEHKIYSHDCPSKYCIFTILDKIPILTGLYIQNNEPGNARIRVTINNEIVKNNDLLGREENQTYNYNFSGNSSVDIIYETLQWKGGDGISAYVCVSFIGNFLDYETDYDNGIKIDNREENNEFWVYASRTDSCSGSIVTKSGDYTITINIIFAGNSQ